MGAFLKKGALENSKVNKRKKFFFEKTPVLCSTRHQSPSPSGPAPC